MAIVTSTLYEPVSSPPVDITTVLSSVLLEPVLSPPIAPAPLVTENIIVLDPVPTPQVLNATVQLTGTYDDAFENMTHVRVLRSDDNGVTFPVIVVPFVAVAGGVFDFNVSLLGPSGSQIVLKVEDATTGNSLPLAFDTSNTITAAFPPLRIADAFYNALGLFEVRFSKHVVINKSYLDPASYQVTSVTGGVGSPVIQKIHAFTTSTYVNYVHIETSQIHRGATYNVAVSGPLRSLDGDVSASLLSFDVMTTQSKMGSLTSKLGNNYKLSLEYNDLVGHILAVVASEDDRIGGGKATIL